MSVVLKRIYDDDTRTGGNRILVDGVWPRGISKEDADLDEWMKDIAPSSPLRKWFNHDPEKFNEFKKSYKEEIQQSSERTEKLDELKKMADGERLILLFAAKETKYNHAVVLKELIEENLT
ncbi:DUF488 family protein [Halobacillus shinanisalinarum]|uniref:DUF488 family protein n=1 Tax=Halobacillus shinanisalinarum TaxID=2932258 RepID=A0ABY4H634_9BACI|nr:DUF488 family protein [Halobacillus shinanisalinarum]UOQ95390.1 DUF488 family protein [Halobacillus shinanisalinarum]